MKNLSRLRRFAVLLVAVMVAQLAVITAPQPAVRALTNAWYPSGPYGGDITGIAQQGSALYVSDRHGVFKSTDDGVTWTDLSPVPVWQVTALYADAGAVYAGRYNGEVYRSTDGGATWALIGGQNNAFNGEVRVVATSGTAIYVGTAGGLFKTTDGGAAWSTLLSIQVLDMTINADGSLYVAVSNVGYPGQTNYVRKSADGGSTWFELTVSASKITHTSDGALYINGVSKSTDGGASWVGAGISAVMVRGFGNVIYAGGSGGVQYSSDGGAAWSTANSGQFYSNFGITAIHKSSATGTVLAGTGLGVYRSTDGGTTFSFSSRGIKWGQDWTNLVMAAASAAEFYAGTPGGLYKSTDGGNVWFPLRQGQVWSMVLTADGVLLVAPGTGGVYRLNRDGTGYQPVGVTSVAYLLRASSGTIYAIGDPTGQGNPLTKSTDNGLTWQAAPSTGVGVAWLFEASDGALYAGGYYTAGLYRLAPGGTVWYQVLSGVTATPAMVQYGANLYLLVNTATGYFLYKSTDNGETWPSVSKIKYVGAPSYYHLAVDSQGSLYAGGEDVGGSIIRKSVDGGQTWFDLATGLPANAKVLALFVAPGDMVFVETPQGVYDPPVASDSQPPTGSVTINGGAALTTNPAVALQITASDNTGVTDMLIAETADFAGAEWQPYSATASFTFTGTGGNRTVYVRLRDGSGNTCDISDSILYDKDPPAGSILINAGAASTASQSVTLNIAGNDDVQVADMMVSEDPAFTGVAWEPFAAGRSFVLSSGTGTKTVYLKLRDVAGRESSVYSDEIVVVQPVVQEGQVTPAANNQRSPQIAGGKIVYCSKHETSIYEVYRFDPATETTQRLAPGSSAWSIKAQGGLAVWEDDTVRVLDLGSGTVSDIGYSGAYDSNTDGQYVVFVDADGDVVLYNPQTSAGVNITNTPDFEATPAVGNGHVVWIANMVIEAYDIAQGTTTQIYSNPSGSAITSLQIRGSKVYWADDRTGAWFVYAYTFGQPQDSEVSLGGIDEASLDSFSVDSDEAHLAYSDGTNVYLVDLGNAQKTLLSSNSAANPVVNDGYVAWTEYNADYDIFYKALASAAPGTGELTVVLSNPVPGAASTLTLAMTTAGALPANATDPNRIEISLPGQDLSGVTPAGIWTAGLAGVGTPSVNEASSSVTIPFTGELAPGSLVTVEIDGLTNQSGEGTVTVSARTEKYGGSGYVAVDVLEGTAGFTSGEIAVSARVARVMEVAVGGSKQHVYHLDPATVTESADKFNTINVQTNSDSFVVVLKEDHPLRAGTVEIGGFGNTASNPGAWSGQSGFGYTVSGPSATGKWQDAFSSPLYAGLTTAGEPVLAGGPGEAYEITLNWKLRVNYGLPPGEYSNVVQVVVTPTYGL